MELIPMLGLKLAVMHLPTALLTKTGDTATAKLTVTVADVDECPVVVNAVNQLDETGVAPDGTESVWKSCG
jgi:hypothetical protein